jgi:hypothetical protein
MAMYHVAVRLSSPPLVRPVRPLYERYFRAEIIPKFRPLSLDQYLGGPIGIVTSAARSATDAEIERYEEWEEAWEREHYPVPQPQYGLIFDAWDDIVEQSFSEWQPGSKEQTQAIQKGFAHLDKLAEKLPKDTNDGAYVERLEEWRRSDFWNMRWEDFD